MFLKNIKFNKFKISKIFLKISKKVKKIIIKKH